MITSGVVVTLVIVFGVVVLQVNYLKHLQIEFEKDRESELKKQEIMNARDKSDVLAFKQEFAEYKARVDSLALRAGFTK